VGFAGSVSASASPRPESANTRYQFGGRAPKSRAAPQDEQTEAPWVQGQADRGIASTRAFSPLVPSHFHLACGLTLYSSAGRAAWLDSHKALHLRSRAYWRSEHPCNQPLLLLVVARVPVVILYLCRRLVGRGVRGGDWAGFGPPAEQRQAAGRRGSSDRRKDESKPEVGTRG
jgi:hypothetical protein